MALRKRLLALAIVLAMPNMLLGCSFDVEGFNQLKDKALSKIDSVMESTDNATIGDKTTDKITNEMTDTANTNSSNNTETANIESEKTTRECKVFYYDSDYNIYSYDENIEIVDKGVVKALTKTLQTAPSSSVNATLPEGIEVRSAKVEDNVLTVNFGADFYDKLNLGSGSEISMLQCIVNTYGYNLGVEKVIIQVDGENYESGHFVLEVGNVFDVDLSKVHEGV